MVQAHQAGSAGVDDSEGPRMSMAMRRQLGIAPAKSPSKATSPHGAHPRNPLKPPQGLPVAMRGTCGALRLEGCPFMHIKWLQCCGCVIHSSGSIRSGWRRG